MDALKAAVGDPRMPRAMTPGAAPDNAIASLCHPLIRHTAYITASARNECRAGLPVDDTSSYEARQTRR